MSTTSLTAGEVMDRSAALLNDPAKTDYTYVAQLPYLNMAIDEFVENLEESNVGFTNVASPIITPQIIVPAGFHPRITPTEHPITPHYPDDLVEIQEVAERPVVAIGDTTPYIALPRREFPDLYPQSQSLLYWSWINQIITFNPAGSPIAHEIRLKYIRRAINLAVDETSIIGTPPILGEVAVRGVMNARSYLSYKTAALCAMFIGENETRAGVLNEQAEKALERVTNIDSKSRQQIMTRHRPFRAAYKSYGGY